MHKMFMTEPTINVMCTHSNKARQNACSCSLMGMEQRLSILLLSSCANEIDALSEENYAVLLLIESHPRLQKKASSVVKIRQRASLLVLAPSQSLQHATGIREGGLDAATITASQSALSLCRRRYCCLRPWPSPMQYCKEGRGRKGEPLSPLSVTRSRFHLCTAKAWMEACWWLSGKVWHHDSLSGRMQSSNIAEYWKESLSWIVACRHRHCLERECGGAGGGVREEERTT